MDVIVFVVMVVVVVVVVTVVVVAVAVVVVVVIVSVVVVVVVVVVIVVMVLVVVVVLVVFVVMVVVVVVIVVVVLVVVVVVVVNVVVKTNVVKTNGCTSSFWTGQPRRCVGVLDVRVLDRAKSWLESFLRVPRKVYRGWKAFFPSAKDRVFRVLRFDCALPASSGCVLSFLWSVCSVCFL